MKKLLLFLCCINGLTAISQNQAPVAINDTLHFSYGITHKHDSLEIDLTQLLVNDFDPDGHSLKIESIIYSGSAAFTVRQPTTFLLSLYYWPTHEFSGLETFKYVLVDEGTPKKRDTTTVAIFIGAKAHGVLEVNNINATITSEALFSNADHLSPGLEAPANSGLYSVFAANIWVAGTLNGRVYSNARMFGSLGNSGPGYTSNPGPVSNLSHTTSMQNSPWNRVWEISKLEIDNHLANYQNPGYITPDVIMDWPTHGIIVKGEAPFLAPYFDRNNDLLYDPYDGDYPIIKGDAAIYFIYNDGNSPYSTQPLISEVHGMAYAFSCGDSAMQNTIFVDYRIINRSSRTYENTSFGMWEDLEIGGPLDDYVGCDVMRNCFFGYNANDNDMSSSGIQGYGVHPPAMGTILLKGPPQDADGMDNNPGIGLNETVNGTGFGDGIIDNEFWGLEFNQMLSNGGTSLGTDLQFYQNISGLDPSNNPWETILPGSTIASPYKYMFPGTSDPQFYGTFGTPINNWTEHSSNSSPSDRRVVGSTGKITFSPGDEINLSYAFVFGRDYVNQGAQAGITNMLERVDSIQSYYDQGLLTPCGFPTSITPVNETLTPFKLYPNPTENLVQIEQIGNEELQIKLMDISGKVLLNKFSSQKIISLRLGDFPKGIYLIEVQNANERKVLKVVKH